MPVDDSLISGPVGGLANPMGLLSPELVGLLDAVLLFPGLARHAKEVLINTPLVENLTASTTGRDHTYKRLIGKTERSIARGADAVAVHVNFSDDREPEMLQSLAAVVEDGERLGMPVVAIVYPRRSTVGGGDDNFELLRDTALDSYLMLVRHAVRAVVELGADVVKTVYTGDAHSFRSVVDSALGVPVLAAGGPVKVKSSEQAATMAMGAIDAGAAGVCFGRRIFEADSPSATVKAIRQGMDIEQGLL